MGPQMARLPGGRLHLQHGPIDLVIGAEGDPVAVEAAFRAAAHRFQTVLQELVAELAALRAPVGQPLRGRVGQRMASAALPLAAHQVTPMIAVAGGVADEILFVMRGAARLRRAYVNNGGDIALHLAQGQRFSVAVKAPASAGLGQVEIRAEDGIGGIATSGQGGRSLSLGIADSVTVLAQNAAAADAAATLIANAVDAPHPQVRRRPASELDPDSDLGARLVVTRVPPLDRATCTAAVAKGARRAERFLAQGHIRGAALFLQGQSLTTGAARIKELQHA